MLTLPSSGLYLAILKSQRGNIIGSIVTFYLITTAWLAGRRGVTGALDRAALLVGIGGATAAITLGVSRPSITLPPTRLAPQKIGLSWGRLRFSDRVSAYY